MKTATDGIMTQWIELNLDITLDRVKPEIGEVWHMLAESDTRTFLRLAEKGCVLCRNRHQDLPPISKKEMTAFLIEFRVKVQMIHDRVPDLPRVAFFDLGGPEFIFSSAFKQQRMLYTGMGGAV